LWVAYGVFAGVSMILGVFLTAAVFVQGPPFAVAGLFGLVTSVVAARTDRASAFVRGTAAVAAVGLACGSLSWVAWKIGAW
jgi:hypothetical protein